MLRCKVLFLTAEVLNVIQQSDFSMSFSSFSHNGALIVVCLVAVSAMAKSSLSIFKTRGPANQAATLTLLRAMLAVLVLPAPPVAGPFFLHLAVYSAHLTGSIYTWAP